MQRLLLHLGPKPIFEDSRSGRVRLPGGSPWVCCEIARSNHLNEEMGGLVEEMNFMHL